MKIIIGFRKTGDKEFAMLRPKTGNPTVIKNKILAAIKAEPEGNYSGTTDPVYDFYITDGSRKSVSNSFSLAGEVVGVIDEQTQLEFIMNEKGDVEIKVIESPKVEETNEEALPQQSTVDQLKRIKKTIDKEIGGDIGDKISDMNKEGANIQYVRNPIKTGIESYQDFERKNRKIFKFKEYKK